MNMLRQLNQWGLGLKTVSPAGFTRSFVVTADSTQNNYDEIENNCDEKIKKIIELEISLYQQSGGKAPNSEKLTPEEWDKILQLHGKKARSRYYRLLFDKEKRAIIKKEEKRQNKIETAGRLNKIWTEEANNNHISYGLYRNTMFLRIRDDTVNQYNNAKLLKAMLFDQKLIIDCSYDKYMNQNEASKAGEQLKLLFCENRLHEEPFDLHFCNFDFNSVTSKALQKSIPTVLDENFPLNIHTESITEKFHKELNNLVYLTPHCRNYLNEYSHDDIYIIGGMVDKTNKEHFSLAKAKRLGIRMARLPLDRYLECSQSRESLNIIQMVKILLELKKQGIGSKP